MKFFYPLMLLCAALFFTACDDKTPDPEPDPNAVSEVKLILDKQTMAEDQRMQMKYEVLPATAKNKAVAWTSSAPAVATVDAEGLVKGVSVGATTITVTSEDGGKSASMDLTITKAIPVTEVKIFSANQTILQGTRVQVEYTVLPTNATNKSVICTSSNDAVATVDALGWVTGVAEGEATITLTSEVTGKSASILVVVQRFVPVTGVTVSQETLEMKVGEAYRLLTCTVLPREATNQNTWWTSSDESVVKVYTGSSLLEALKPGKATIIVTTVDGRKTASCEVTVTEADK